MKTGGIALTVLLLIALLAGAPGCGLLDLIDPLPPTPTSTATIEDIIADIEPDQVDLDKATAINNPPTDSEKADLAYAREEAKLARDLYQKFNEKWNLPILATMARDEQRYMDRVKTLLDALKLPDPALATVGEFTNPSLKLTYDSLLGRGMTSASAALSAGAYLEELLIKDLGVRVENVFRLDIIRGLGAVYSGSRSHLLTLFKELKNRGVTYSPQVLSADEFNRIVNPPLK
jgi:hypothetical protein